MFKFTWTLTSSTEEISFLSNPENTKSINHPCNPWVKYLHDIKDISDIKFVKKRVGKGGGDACLARTGVDWGSGMTSAGRLDFFLEDFLLITGSLI